MAFTLKTGRTIDQRLEEIGLSAAAVQKAIDASDNESASFEDTESVVEVTVPKNFRMITGKGGEYHALTWESEGKKYTLKSMDVTVLNNTKTAKFTRTASCWLDKEGDIALNVTFEAWVGSSSKYTKAGVEMTREDLKSYVENKKPAEQAKLATQTDVVKTLSKFRK
jgi:hypothetical protein